jgi:4-amino-4-deoxy-L-arabinose transferase-like glycosyltransferase
MNRQTLIKTIVLLLGFVLLSVPLWLKVDHLPLRLWDESRNAVNAAEMFESGDLIVRSFNYSPEEYNLKPPLLTWLQVLGMHVFGYEEIAIRLPSVLASIGSLILVYFIVFSITGNAIFSFLGSGITVTSAGFYGDHVGRFGDHDALLVFFCCLLVYHALRFIQSKHNKHLYFAGIAVCLGILTKSISILVLIPGIVVVFGLNKSLIPTIKNKHFYIAMISALIPIGLYYGLREYYQPGFLSLVWNDELFPRYFNQSKNLQFNEGDFWYYFKLIYSSHFKPWVFLLLTIPLAFFIKTKARKNLLSVIIIALSFLLIISKGTKNFWYDAPLIPLLGIVATLSLYTLVSYKINNRPIQIGLVLAILIFPFLNTYKVSLSTAEKHYNWENHGVSYFLKDQTKHKYLSNHTKIVLDSIYGFEPHKFYLEKLKSEENIDLQRKWFAQVKVGDTLLVSHLSTQEALKAKFKLTTIDSINQYTKLLAVKQLSDSTNLY